MQNKPIIAFWQSFEDNFLENYQNQSKIQFASDNELLDKGKQQNNVNSVRQAFTSLSMRL